MVTDVKLPSQETGREATLRGTAELFTNFRPIVTHEEEKRLHPSSHWLWFIVNNRSDAELISSKNLRKVYFCKPKRIIINPLIKKWDDEFCDGNLYLVVDLNHFSSSQVFRTDLITAMKLHDSYQLNPEDYYVLSDPWRQEWEKGVQVPVSPEFIPDPSVRYVPENLPSGSAPDYLSWIKSRGVESLNKERGEIIHGSHFRSRCCFAPAVLGLTFNFLHGRRNVNEVSPLKSPPPSLSLFLSSVSWRKNPRLCCSHDPRSSFAPGVRRPPFWGTWVSGPWRKGRVVTTWTRKTWRGWMSQIRSSIRWVCFQYKVNIRDVTIHTRHDTQLTIRF